MKVFSTSKYSFMCDVFWEQQILIIKIINSYSSKEF